MSSPVDRDGRRPSAAGTVSSVVVGAAPLAVGAVGSLFTAESVRTWYPTLDKPAWKPPDRAFGPVWTILYVAMGIALLRIWRLDRGRAAVRAALLLFLVQLALNLGWSWIFFARRDVRGALAEIVALEAAIAATAVSFARLDRLAAALLVPYLGWTAFATVLNAEIARRNG
jgi:tryptophan-rich sensory protein